MEASSQSAGLSLLWKLGYFLCYLKDFFLMQSQSRDVEYTQIAHGKTCSLFKGFKFVLDACATA